MKTFKSIMEDMVDKCHGLTISSLDGINAITVSLLYDGECVLSVCHRKTRQHEEEAYEKLFFDIMESGVKRLCEISGFLSSIGS